jgi:hypothetical protein
MRKLFLAVCVFLLINRSVIAQELFAYTEPASNMSAKSMGIRLNNYVFKNSVSKQYQPSIYPEIMLGISRKVMMHVEGFFNSQQQFLNWNGSSLYIKYRYFSTDEVHSHFRMAVFGKIGYNNSMVNQQFIDIGKNNSGFEIGTIATRLKNKFALSASLSASHAFDNLSAHSFGYENKSRNVINYTISAGQLFLPKEYVNYDQLNVNGMLEILGQTNLYTKQSYLDVASVIQFIIKSKARIDLGYSFPLNKSLNRINSSGALVRLEYNFFSIF